jgi:hypothetical protein
MTHPRTARTAERIWPFARRGGYYRTQLLINYI